MKSFEDLECWKKSTALRRRLSVLVKTFPNDEKYKLIDQIVRASRSVTANIAEGYGRYSYQEYIQFCRQSRGSLTELIDHLIVANDEGYIIENELHQLRNDIDGCLAILNGFINYLTRAKSQSQDNKIHEPESFYEADDSQLTFNE